MLRMNMEEAPTTIASMPLTTKSLATTSQSGLIPKIRRIVENDFKAKDAFCYPTNSSPRNRDT